MEILYIFFKFFVGGILGIVLWESRKHKIDNLTVILFLVTFILILFSIQAPILFTQYSSFIYFDEKTGQIGDTIGGIMNPFISMAAVIVTGMAFYAQYRANEMVRKQFELQKFETQFYEMLRLHKENVNEIQVKTSDNEIIKGREVFFEMKKELESLFEILDKNSNDLDQDTFRKIYVLFFWGNNYERKQSDQEAFGKTNNSEWVKNFEVNEEKSTIKEFNLKGYHSCLGHYYRHLYHIVKFVASQKESVISEDRKIEYLRILRNQLSNHEQEMLFYNWLSGYGGNWENEEKSFFTKYKMIHNLWYFELYETKFLRVKLKCLVRKYRQLNRKDDLFEIGDDIDEYFKKSPKK